MGVSCGDDQVNSLKGLPLVLFADVVLLAEIDEVSDGLGSQQGEAVDDLNLRVIMSIQYALRQSGGHEKSESHKISLDNGALLPPQRAGLFERLLFFIARNRFWERDIYL